MPLTVHIFIWILHHYFAAKAEASHGPGRAKRLKSSHGRKLCNMLVAFDPVLNLSEVECVLLLISSRGYAAQELQGGRSLKLSRISINLAITK